MLHIGIPPVFSAVVGGQIAAIAPPRQSGTERRMCFSGWERVCVCVRALKVICVSSYKPKTSSSLVHRTDLLLLLEMEHTAYSLLYCVSLRADGNDSALIV